MPPGRGFADLPGIRVAQPFSRRGHCVLPRFFSGLRIEARVPETGTLLRHARGAGRLDGRFSGSFGAPRLSGFPPERLVEPEPPQSRAPLQKSRDRTPGILQVQGAFVTRL